MKTTRQQLMQLYEEHKTIRRVAEVSGMSRSEVQRQLARPKASQPEKNKCCVCGKGGENLLEYPTSANSEWEYTWIHPKCLLDVVDGRK